MSCTRPCERPVHGRVHVPCTGPCTRHVHGRRRKCRRPVHSHIHGWFRRAVCTAHTRPSTGRVYGTAVIRPSTGRFRGRRRVYDTLHGRVYGPYAATQRPSTRPLTARTRPCNCRVDFPCTPYTWRCNGCVHVSTAHGPCIRLSTWPLRLHGPYTAIIRRQDNTTERR